MIENMNKVFFTPGDVVQIKHDLPFKPLMLVKGKETKMIKPKEDEDEDKSLDKLDRKPDSPFFIGIKCFWFTTELAYQEQIFSTKDLVRVSATTFKPNEEVLSMTTEQRHNKFEQYKGKPLT